jgi:deoxyribonuclease-4
MATWIGAHVSAAGGVDNAPENAEKIGASALALFTKNQRQWSAKPYTEELIERFKARLQELGFSPEQVLPHASYLINLGAPDDRTRERSYGGFVDELTRVEQLGLRYLNFHPGSSKGEIEEAECVRRIAECMNAAAAETEYAVLVLETTAGQGSALGANFAELARIVEQCTRPERVGFCIDTAHAFGAGYDIRNEEGWNAMMEEAERALGLDKLCGFHLNDTSVELGSRKDRHERIGYGSLGYETFRRIMQDPRTQNLPLILETTDPQRWAEEISILRGYAGESTGV